MNELDVKDVFARVLDAPREPGADRETILSLGRRARRRRTAAWTGSAGATALVIAAVAVVALPGRSPGPDAAVDPAQVSTGNPTTAPATSEPAPPRTEEQYAQDLLAALPTLIPPGFTFPTENVFTDTDGTKYLSRGAEVFPPRTIGGETVSPDSIMGSLPHGVNAYTDVYRDGKQASVTVTAVDSAVPTDLCAADIDHQGTENGCRVAIAVNGAHVRLAWRDIAGYGRIWYATRYYAHRRVTVQEMPGGMNPHLSNYGPIWDDAALVEVAANPVLAP